MSFNPQTSSKLVVSSDKVREIVNGYREMLALIDSPVFLAKDRAVQGMFHAQVNATRSIMRHLMGNDEWERTCVVYGWDRNYLEMQKEAADIPVESEILALPWDKS